MDQQGRQRGGDTVLQLKDDIDSGRTGDKVATADPGMASLGTCDEAAGTAPTPERIALARKQEAEIGRIARTGDKPKTALPLITLLGTIVVLAAVMVVFFLVR